MKKNIIISSFVLFYLGACKNSADKAKDIIHQSIEAYGDVNYDNFMAEFDSGNSHFKLKHEKKDGLPLRFQYERIVKDSLRNDIWDVVNNEGFLRIVNGNQIQIPENDTKKYANEVNSIADFVLLPYKMKDESANFEYLGETIIDNQKYDKVKVWLGQESKNAVCYWINQKTHLFDYIATTNNGSEFSKVNNHQTVGGIIIQTYENFAISDTTSQIGDFDKAFLTGNVSRLSLIDPKNIMVK